MTEAEPLQSLQSLLDEYDDFTNIPLNPSIETNIFETETYIDHQPDTTSINTTHTHSRNEELSDIETSSTTSTISTTSTSTSSTIPTEIILEYLNEDLNFVEIPYNPSRYREYHLNAQQHFLEYEPTIPNNTNDRDTINPNLVFLFDTTTPNRNVWLKVHEIPDFANEPFMEEDFPNSILELFTYYTSREKMAYIDYPDDNTTGIARSYWIRIPTLRLTQDVLLAVTRYHIPIHRDHDNHDNYNFRINTDVETFIPYYFLTTIEEQLPIYAQYIRENQFYQIPLPE